MKTLIKKIFLFLAILLPQIIIAQSAKVDVNADLVSRYIWRGANVNESPNIQPALTLTVGGFSAGFWGSYCIANTSETNSFSHEIDTWIEYDYPLSNGMSVGAIITDYYFPQAGVRFGNFNNYDNKDGAGAHTFEAGILFKGPETFPISLSGYMNFYNDAGNNTYFQIDYPVGLNDVSLNFFIGASAGSKENPGFYSTEGFNVINAGITASKSIKITEDYSLPINTSFIINPRTDIAYMVFGLSF